MNKWQTLHASDECESQGKLQILAEEGEKYKKYGMKAKIYGNNYVNNLHVVWDLIKNLKVFSNIKWYM